MGLNLNQFHFLICSLTFIQFEPINLKLFYLFSSLKPISRFFKLLTINMAKGYLSQPSFRLNFLQLEQINLQFL